ncbi:MAG: hypothetical protein ACOC41_00185 [Chitinivibrionales bacterium]
MKHALLTCVVIVGLLSPDAYSENFASAALSDVSLYQSSHRDDYSGQTSGEWLFNATSPIDHRGRTWLIAATTAKTAYMLPDLYSIALSGLEEKTRTGLTYFSIGATLFGTYGLTQNIDIGYGRAALMNYGATIGYLYPLQISRLLHYATDLDQMDNSDDITSENQDFLLSEKIRAWSTLLSVPYGIYAGWRAAEDDISFGDASVMIYFSQTLGALGYILPLLRWDPALQEQKDDYHIASSAATMALVPIGLMVGRRVTENHNFSSGNGVLLYVTGAMGAATGLFLPQALDFDKDMTEQERRYLYLGASTAGYLLGSYIGVNLNEHTGITFRQALFIGGSAIAGGLIGTSIPYYTDVKKESTYMLAAMAGSWLGLAVGNELVNTIREKSAQRENSSFHVTLPAALNLPLALAADKRSAKNKNMQLPMVHVNVQF